MRTTSVLFVAVVAAACLATAAGQGTKGTTLRGFTFTTDVSAYLNISRDICDIKHLLNNPTPPYHEAQAIYMDGKNARRPDGSKLSLRELATGANYGEKFWDLYTKVFGTPVWLDDTMIRGFSGLEPFALPVQRVQLIVKNLESATQVAFMMHSIDRAIEHLQEKNKSRALGSLDKAWAIYVGADDRCGLWTVSMKRANEYGTKITCEASAVATNIQKAFLEAQKAINAGDMKGLEAARAKIQQQLIVNYIQAMVTYAHELYLDKSANISVAENQVEAYAFWRTIKPLIAAANETAAEAIDYWLFPGQPVPTNVDLKVLRALGTAYDFYGITPDDVGEYGRKQPALGCKAYVAKADEQGGLLSTTNAKDSLRPGDSKDATAADAGAAPAAKPAAAAKAAPAKGARRLFQRLFLRR